MEMQCNKMSAPNMVGHTTRKRNSNRHLKGNPSSALRLSAPRYSKRRLLKKIMMLPRKARNSLNATTDNASNTSINEDENVMNMLVEDGKIKIPEKVTEEFQKKKPEDPESTIRMMHPKKARYFRSCATGNASNTSINKDENVVNTTVQDGKIDIPKHVSEEVRKRNPEDPKSTIRMMHPKKARYFRSCATGNASNTSINEDENVMNTSKMEKSSVEDEKVEIPEQVIEEFQERKPEDPKSTIRKVEVV
ncbi:uncharacterized protein LOC117218924 isoform X1 [Megalopta genalis]|uniref:uncharacterized protein LOC117218924 isoform X1 n=2 Tax=Megalopta genalis TaxID=115081 RepID=UPI003FD3FDBD